MATIIDALLVSLGLDATGFEKNAGKVLDTQDKIKKKATESTSAVDVQEKKLSEAQAKRAKQMELRSKEIALGVTKLRNELLGLAAVVTGGVGLKAFFTNAINSAAGLDRMSANLGMSAKELSMWQLAAKNAGGTAEGMTAQLKESASEIAKYKSGIGPTEGMQWFLRLGGDPAAFKDGNTYLLARADILAKIYKIDPSRAMLMAANMGITEDTLPLIRQGAADIEKLRQTQAGLADEMANLSKPAEQIRKDIDALGNSFNASGLKIVGVFLPAIKGVADELKNVAGFLGDEQAMDQVGERIAKVFAFFGNKEAQEALDANQKGYLIAGSSSTLNKGEDAELARRRKMPITIDGSGKPVKSLAKDKPQPGKPVPASAGGIMSQLKELGWTQAQASGITASFIQESNLDHEAVNPKSGARGIGQWLGSRVGDFKKWAGIDLKDSTAKQQIDFFHHEVTSGKEQAAGRKLRATTTAEDAARVHSEAYERPGKAEANNERRMRLAAEINAQAAIRNAQAAANMPMGAAAAQGSSGGSRSTSTSETNINGPITIHTQATDATGIAKSIGPAMSNYGLVAQANTGVN